MPAEGLLDGVAIVIDDQWEDRNANIAKILRQIEEKNIPYIPYNKLPDSDTTRHFHDISFFLLDWKLDSAELADAVAEGVRRPRTLTTEAIRENIVFLNKLKERCFAPIFIFTDDEPDTIKATLKENHLYSDEKPNYIFVKSKGELTDGRLFNEIESWLKTTPSIYVLMEWEREYGKAKNKLFHDFYALSPSWPKVLWENFTADNVNQSLELGEVINKNLHTRMAPFDFDGEYINNAAGESSAEELRIVLGGERFINNDCLHGDSIATGDVFKFAPNDKILYLNIRPDCDCIAGRPGNAIAEDVDLYLIKGEKLNGRQEAKYYKPSYGQFGEMIHEAIIFSMFAGKSYRYEFKNLTIKKWSEIKSARIGRLLPPHITRIQQRYALYMQRQGLPRTPEKAIIGEVPGEIVEAHVSSKDGEELKYFGHLFVDKIQNVWRYIRRRV